MKVGLQEITLKPGQFVFGRRAAAKELRMGEKQIRNILTFLKKAGNVAIKTTNKFSIITIINWPTYQSQEIEKGQQKGQQGASKGPQTRTREQKKVNADVKKFIEWWCETFKTNFRTKYHVTGNKEGMIIKRLLATDSYQGLIKLAEAFFDSQDSFIKDAGYTISIFSSQINKLKSQGIQRHERYAT